MTPNSFAPAGLRKPERAQGDPSLAASITKAASKQTYYTIRFLVDRDLIPEAYRAYGYFRWFDDQLDQDSMARPDRLAFAERQRSLIDRCYQGEPPRQLTDEENILADLIQSDREPNSGLRSYIYNMAAVMSFDAERRGRLITQKELAAYTLSLATAVTEALHYFIGHRCQSPRGETRYLAVTAAHVVHMLRDTLADTEAGYFNIPHEYLEAHGIGPRDLWSEPYQKWVRSRIELARSCFKSGKGYLARVESPRCRMAGYAYMARFDAVMDIIEQDGYRLRREYAECKSVKTAMRMGWSMLSQVFSRRCLLKTFPVFQPDELRR